MINNIKHWTEGGTGLTNFDIRDFHAYNFVIEEFERMFLKYPKGLFWIEKSAMRNPAGATNLYSLHKKRGFTDASTDFWFIFRNTFNYTIGKGYKLNKEWFKECSADVY